MAGPQAYIMEQSVKTLNVMDIVQSCPIWRCAECQFENVPELHRCDLCNTDCLDHPLSTPTRPAPAYMHSQRRDAAHQYLDDIRDGLRALKEQVSKQSQNTDSAADATVHARAASGCANGTQQIQSWNKSTAGTPVFTSLTVSAVYADCHSAHALGPPSDLTLEVTVAAKPLAKAIDSVGGMSVPGACQRAPAVAQAHLRAAKWRKDPIAAITAVAAARGGCDLTPSTLQARTSPARVTHSHRPSHRTPLSPAGEHSGVLYTVRARCTLTLTVKSQRWSRPGQVQC